jgi:hypothetical protein
MLFFAALINNENMKKIFVILFAGLALIAKAQEVSVEKSIFSVQTGLLGVWVQNEARISNKIALRSEAGFDSGIWGGTYYDKVGFLMAPVLTLEPRFYYNIEKRNLKSKRIDNNSGNFLSIKTSYHPDWFVISNQHNISIISDLSIVPTWGMRRNIGKHFNYEVGGGIGYQYVFGQKGYSKGSYVAYNLLLRIGYTF